MNLWSTLLASKWITLNNFKSLFKWGTSLQQTFCITHIYFVPLALLKIDFYAKYVFSIYSSQGNDCRGRWRGLGCIWQLADDIGPNANSDGLSKMETVLPFSRATQFYKIRSAFFVEKWWRKIGKRLKALRKKNNNSFWRRYTSANIFHT